MAGDGESGEKHTIILEPLDPGIGATWQPPKVYAP